MANTAASFGVVHAQAIAALPKDGVMYDDGGKTIP